MKFRITYSDRLLMYVTGCISLIAFIYFYLHGQENLSYYDALARLNTARKMIDSITPGIGQLGGVWLPFPQILMVPFIWNDFLWHTGIAGYIISGLSFIIGSLYLQKAVFILTQNRKIALLIWLSFVSNVNILLLQTMAMSEVFFLCFFILTFYYLILWVKDKRFLNFLQTAFCIMVLTLTRYEGYFVFAGVLLAIVIECVRTYSIKNRDKIEGMMLVFLFVAGFGIILWCIYSALFYKDPLFWLHAYTPPPASVLTAKPAVVDVVYGIQNPSLLQSYVIYSSVALWTIGVITFILGILGLAIFCFRPKRMFASLWIVSIVLFLCLGLGYYKGFIPHIEFPPVFLTGVNIRDWSVYADNNVRYGIVFLPCILFFVAFLAKQSKAFFIIVLLFVFEQCYFTLANPQLLQYPFDKSWRYPHFVEVPWFDAHYTGGLILIAADRHEDFMFETGLSYNKFIYEGTRRYWTDSLAHPSEYAAWVIFDTGDSDDDVYQGLTHSGVKELLTKYTLVYVYKGFHVYVN